MTDYKKLCAELLDWTRLLIEIPDPPVTRCADDLTDLLARTRAALAEPEPVGAITAAEAEQLAHEAGFSAVDSYEDELRQTFVVWEATTAQLTAVLNAAIALDRSRRQLQPEEPTVMEIIELADEIEKSGLGQIDLVRAALARWGNNTTRSI